MAGLSLKRTQTGKGFYATIFANGKPVNVFGRMDRLQDFVLGRTESVGLTSIGEQ